MNKQAQPEQEKEPETIEAEIAQIEKRRQELEAWANSVWEARATHGTSQTQGEKLWMNTILI